MEAKDLRIGNKVLACYDVYNELFEEVTVGCIDTIGVTEHGYTISFEDGGREHYEDINPIPLTEEWLVKFGVEELLNQDVYRVNYVNYHKGTNCFSYCLGYYHDDQGYVDNIFKDVNHVHQLQNLYFALTGEELTIK